MNGKMSDIDKLKALDQDITDMTKRELWPMPETLLPHPRWSDDLPEVTQIGDEGQWYMVRGHIPFEIATAAFVVDLARTIGTIDTYEMYLGGGMYSLDTLAYGNDLQHTYVVEKTFQEGDDHIPEVSVGDPYINLKYKDFPREEWIPVTMWSTH